MYTPTRTALLVLLPTALGTRHPEQHVLRAAAQICHPEPLWQWQTPGTCPTDGLAPASNATAAGGPGDGWIRGSVCHEIPGGSDAPFCAYTLPSFHGGLGVSVVTTPEVFARVAALPVFLPPAAASTPGPDARAAAGPPAYREVAVPGKGVGLVAARRVAAGEALLARTPAVMVDDAAFRRLGRARLAELLAAAVDGLPAAHRAEYLALTTHDGAPRTHAETAHQIFMKNNFRTPVEGVEVFHSTFTRVSRLNHACRPNSDYFFDDRTLSHNVFSAQVVDAGEELTVTYSDPIQPRLSRQAFLRHHWGFTCACALCAAPDAEAARSDARVAEILALRAELDDYSAASAATPGKAERAAALYRDEGLATRMVEAHYRAAVEYNGVGDAARARARAAWAVRDGEVMEAGIRPFLGSMRELARDPEAHWSWRFRLRGGG